MPKLAPQADLWYNSPRINVCPGGAENTPRREIHLIGGVPMDILSPYSPDDNHNGEKQCTNPNCKRWYPATLEFFGCDKQKKDGLSSRCKACKREEGAVRRSRPEYQEYMRVYHKAHYPIYIARPGVLEHRREHGRIATKAYYKRPEVHERKRAYDKDYRSRPEIREHLRSTHKAYLRTYRSRPEVQEREHLRRHHPKYKEQSRANTRNHEARKQAVQGTHTAAQIQEQLKRQKYRCYYAACGHAKFEKRNGKYIYHIDHTFPLSRVIGTDIPANDISYLVLTCPTCNMSKGDKYPWEWIEGGRLL